MASRNFPCKTRFEKKTMALFCICSTAGSPQVHHIHGVWFIYKVVEFSAVPQVESGIDFCVISFGANYEGDALKNSCLNNYCPLSISYPTSYAVKFRSKCRDELFPDPARGYVIALGGQRNKFFAYRLPLIILVDSSIQVCVGILVHPILIDV